MLPSPTPDPRLLAIEDDPTLDAYLFQYLSGGSFEVTWCRDRKEGLVAIRSGAYDLILMDIMLPGRDGLEILRQLRQEQALSTVLVSALNVEQDRIAKFSQDADDYLPEPPSLAGLRVRIDVILHRIALEQGGVPGRCAESLTQPSLQLSTDVYDVSLGERLADLTSTECRLPETLLAAEDRILTRAFLYQYTLHHGHTQHDRSLDIHTSHLQRKPQHLSYAGHRLYTVWGKGYVLTSVP